MSMMNSDMRYYFFMTNLAILNANTAPKKDEALSLDSDRRQKGTLRNA